MANGLSVVEHCTPIYFSSTWPLLDGKTPTSPMQYAELVYGCDSLVNGFGSWRFQECEQAEAQPKAHQKAEAEPKKHQKAEAEPKSTKCQI